MLINLRNALMTGKRLPYDAEVEYLESTGTQWIDTGLPIAPNFYLDATFSIPSTIPHVLTFMGTTTLSQPYYRFWVCSIQTNKTINCGLINNAISTATLTADEPHNIYVKFFDGEQLCKLDGTTIVSATNTSDSSAKAAWLAQGNLFIGRSRLNEQFNFIGKVFAVKIYDANGTLVRDFVPVRKGTVGYLYDRVTRKLFGNAGTGDFVLGPDKN